jgi:hypothetical protein
MWPRELPRVFAPGPVSPKTLVAMTTFSRSVDRLADQALGVGLLQVANLGPQARAATEGHRAQAELRDEEAGSAEGAVAHGR